MATDVHDDWPPKEFSGLLDMVAQGGLPDTLQRMLSDKDYFRSEEALGPAYEHAQDVTDETIEAYLRPWSPHPREPTTSNASSLHLTTCKR
jgi:hypothetical protein